MDGFLAFFLERSDERNDRTFGSFRYSPGISFISTSSALPRYLMLCWIERLLRLSHLLCTKYAYSIPFTLLVLMYANKQYCANRLSIKARGTNTNSANN